MELRNLKTFYFASQFLNYSRTAEYLNFTQPTVTLQIKNLEDELGHQLFMRIGQRTFLTPAGEILAKHVKTIFGSIKAIQADLSLLDHPVGSLNIAADISFCVNNLQPIISEFYKHNPQVKTKIISWNSSRVIRGIEQNEVDVGFISGNYQNSQIEELEISEDPVLLVVSREDYHQNPRLIKTLPLIKYHTDSPYSDSLDLFIRKNNLAKRRTIEYSNLEAVKSAVLHKVGIAPLTEDVVKRELDEGLLVSLAAKYKSVNVKTSMIYLKEKSNWKSIQALRKLVDTLWIGAVEQSNK